MDEEKKILKNSRKRSSIFLVLYVILMIASAVGFVIVAKNISISGEMNLLQYILSGGK